MVPTNSRVLSFKYAFAGIIDAIKREPNLKFHLLAAFIVCVLGFLLQIQKTDWIIVLTLIGLVISVELTNTAIEVAVDSFIGTQSQAAKLAKDIAAGAVLVVASTSAIVGLIIFAPYIFKLWII